MWIKACHIFFASKGATILFDALKICKSMVALYVGWNEIDDSYFKLFVHS